MAHKSLSPCMGKESEIALGVSCVGKRLHFRSPSQLEFLFHLVELNQFIQAVIQAPRRAGQANSTRESKFGCVWRVDFGLELPLQIQVHISNSASTYGIGWQLGTP